MMETAEELAEKLRKAVRFRYMTVDRFSVKLWRTRKPHFSREGGFWVGGDSCGFIDLADAKLIAPADFRTAIVEVV